VNGLPRWLVYAAIALVVASWLPLAVIARARGIKTTRPRFHVVPDMDNQQRFNPQARTTLFADRRAMRPPVEGTVARGDLREDDALFAGKVGEEWLKANPLQVTVPLLERGRQRYEIFCAPCHGLSGNGDGPVAKRAEAIQEGTWTPPSSLHGAMVRGREDGHLFSTVSHGIRNMPGYAAQIPVADRWAIVAYLRALQRSQITTLDDVPPEARDQLR